MVLALLELKDKIAIFAQGMIVERIQGSTGSRSASFGDDVIVCDGSEVAS